MTDPFERRLQEEMHRSTERLSLPPAPEVRRRVRLRQAFTVLAAAVALGAIGVAGAAAFDALGDGSKTNLGPAGGDEKTPDAQSSDERGSGGTYPCQPREFVETCIAEGTYEDVSWAIGVQMDDSLCMTQQTESPTQGGVASGAGVGGSSEVGGRNGCMTYRPDRLELATLGSNDPDGYFASGYAGADIASATVETESGDVIDLQLYPAPSGHPIEGVQFFAVFLPSDATEIVGYDATGNELDRQLATGDETSFPNSQDPAQREAMREYRKGYVRVDGGEIAGYPWVVEARLGTLNLPEGVVKGDELCSFLTVGTDLGITANDPGVGGGGNCFSGSPLSFGYTRMGLTKDPGLAVFFGAIAPGVDHLFVEIDGRDQEQGYISEIPAELETDLRIFTVFIETEDPTALTGRIVTYDASGAEIDEIELCRPKFEDLGICRTGP